MIKLGRKIVGSRGQLSSFRSNKRDDDAAGSKKQIRFDETLSFQSPPYSQGYLHDSSLWYTTHECNANLWKDIEDLIKAGATMDDPSARGLEMYITTEMDFLREKHARNQYRRAITKQQLKRSTKMTALALLQVARRRKEKFSTACSKKAARQRACSDEMQARTIYLEDNAAWAAKVFRANIPH